MKSPLTIDWKPQIERGYALRLEGHWIADPETGDVIIYKTIFDAVSEKESMLGDIEIVPVHKANEISQVVEEK